MREGETDFVRANFASLGARAFAVEEAASQFLSSLATAVDPEAKRHFIGEEFVRVQQRILESEDFLSGRWILGQGTIYPDTIVSAKAPSIPIRSNRAARPKRT
jgi:GMP synthase (glutamine-hydrolysing)